MISEILNGLWEFLAQIGKWLLDLLIWLFEFVYNLINDFIDFIATFLTNILIWILKSIKEIIETVFPENLLRYISDVKVYEWLEYADSWVPVSFGLKVFLLYHGIKILLIIFKFIVKFIPFI